MVTFICLFVCFSKKRKDTRALIENKHNMCRIIPSTDLCAVGSKQEDVVRTEVLARSIARLTGYNFFISHLHLLVDLPLYGVRRFSAAFIFRWSAFLHLWHSPGSGWIRSGSLLRVSRRVFRGAAESESCHSRWQRLSFRTAPSLIWGFAPFESTEHAYALSWRLRRRTIATLSSPTLSNIRR